MITRILTAAAFTALLAGSAVAQDTPPPADPAADAMAQGMEEPAPMTDATTTAVYAGPPPAGATNVTVRTVTNGPVPDTAENRARYGQPMSNAGKRTTPAGN